MEKIKMKCASCSGVLEVNKDHTILFCPYCGSKELLIDSDEVQKAKIRANVDIEKMRLENEELKRKHSRKEYVILGIIGIASVILFIVIVSLI